MHGTPKSVQSEDKMIQFNKTEYDNFFQKISDFKSQLTFKELPQIEFGVQERLSMINLQKFFSFLSTI